MLLGYGSHPLPDLAYVVLARPQGRYRSRPLTPTQNEAVQPMLCSIFRGRPSPVRPRRPMAAAAKRLHFTPTASRRPSGKGTATSIGIRAATTR